MAQETLIYDIKVDDSGINDAAKATEKLGNEAEKAANSLNDVGSEVDVVEGRIKVLGGSINILGGTVETVVGTMGLIGVPEEAIENIEKTTLSAIALADGTKRTFEGFKELREGIIAYGGAQKIAATATRFFGAAVRFATGPVGLIITALGAFAAAVVFLKDKVEIFNKIFNFFKGAIDSVAEALGFAKTETEKFQEAQGELVDDLEFELNLLKEQGASIDELIKKERELLQTKINATKEGTQERIEAERELALFEARIEREREEREAKAKEERAAKRKEEEEAFERKKEEELSIVSLKKKTANLEIKINNDVLKNVQETNQKKIEAEKEAAAKRLAIAQAEEQAKQALLTDGIDNIQGALTALFGENKAIASANVLIDAAQAGVGILKNSQTTGPFAIAYQATQFALLAATTISSLRQINAAEPGGSATAPSSPRPSIPFNGGVTTGGATAGTFTAPTTTAELPPVRAYVLAGEVSDGVEANNRLNRRRTF